LFINKWLIYELVGGKNFAFSAPMENEKCSRRLQLAPAQAESLCHQRLPFGREILQIKKIPCAHLYGGKCSP
jgi:hypothetical protein